MPLDAKAVAAAVLKGALAAAALGASPLAVSWAYATFVPEGSVLPAIARAIDEFQEQPAPKAPAQPAQAPAAPAAEPGERRIEHVIVAAATSGCRAPRPPEAHERVIAFSAYDGVKMAPYSLAGGARTDVATVTVEPGGEMAYLVLASHRPMVWRIEGARERVAHVVATSTLRTGASGLGEGGSGVVGVRPANVTFMADFFCLPSFADADGKDGTEARKRIQAMLGRAPEYLGAAGRISSVSLPSMKVEGPGPGSPYIAPSFGEAGAGPVATATAPTHYPPLQGDLGVEQMALAGKLAALPSDGAAKAYRINAAVTLPRDVSPSTRFTLSDGVPMPEGIAPSTCVRSVAGIGLTPACRALDERDRALAASAASAKEAASKTGRP